MSEKFEEIKKPLVSPEIHTSALEQNFDDFLLLGEKCLSVVDRVNQSMGDVLRAECVVNHNLPVDCELKMCDFGGIPIISQCYEGESEGHLWHRFGEKILHTDEDPFRVKSAQMRLSKAGLKLILREDIIKEDDPDKLGRRAVIFIPSQHKEQETTPDISSDFLALKFDEFIQFSQQAYDLESLYPDNYNEFSMAQLNVNFIAPEGWVMNCYPKNGSSLSEISDIEIMITGEYGDNYFGQYNQSNPFSADWIISDSIPGYGIWPESYLIKGKGLNRNEMRILPEQLGDLSVEFAEI